MKFVFFIIRFTLRGLNRNRINVNNAYDVGVLNENAMANNKVFIVFKFLFSETKQNKKNCNSFSINRLHFVNIPHLQKYE